MNPAFERLEDRLLLAASVVQKGSTLVVTDDGTGDNVLLTGTALGAITVTGAATGNDNYTGIKHVKIVGGAGVDFIELIGVRIDGNVTADLKGGDDQFDIFGDESDIGGNVKVTTGAGDDLVRLIHPTHIGKNVSIDLGDAGVNGDFLDITGIIGGGNGTVTIDGGVTVKGRGGEQAIAIDSADIGKNLKIDLGNGNDVVGIGAGTTNANLSVLVGGSVTIKLGDGDDDVDFGDDVAGVIRGTIAITKNLTIDLGNSDGSDGGDRLDIDATDIAHDEITVGGNVSVKGKGGVQRVKIDGLVVTKNVSVSLGDGNDEVDVNQGGGSIDTSIGGNLKVNLGGGDADDLEAQDVNVTKNVTLDGGAGNNDAADDTAAVSIAVLGKTKIKGFELGNLVT